MAFLGPVFNAGASLFGESDFEKRDKERKRQAELRRQQNAKFARNKSRFEEAKTSSLQDILARQQKEGPELSKRFANAIRPRIGAQVAGAGARLEQKAGRAGLAFSGVAQAGQAQVEVAGQRQLAGDLAAFQSKLQQFHAQEQATFQAHAFDFMNRLIFQASDQEFQEGLAQFQAQVQADLQANQVWQEILGTAAEIGTLAVFI